MKLKELGVIITGNTPSKNKKEFYNSSDICFFKPSDLEEDKINYLESSEEYISENARDVARILPKDALLMTCIGTIGKIGVLKKEATCNQQINAIIPNELVIPEYLGYLLLSKKEYLKKKANAPVVPIINKTDFSSIDVNICDIEEQKNIVVKLNKINELILLRKKEIEKCNGLIKSQFVEMFKGCPQTKLCEIANITMGQSPNSESYNDSADGTPFFQGKADYGDKYTIVKHWTNQPSKIAYKGDVLMSVRAPVGPVNIASCDCCIGRGLCSITAKDGLTNNEFLFNALNTIQEEIASKGTGSTFKAIIKNDVYNIELPLGSIELQNKFAQIVEQIDKQKFVNLKIFQLLGKKLKK